MEDRADRRHGGWAFALTVSAFLWSVALLAGAFLVPVYAGTSQSSTSASGAGTITTTPRSPAQATAGTLVDGNGAGVLIAVALPAVLTLLVWLALHRRCSGGSRSSSCAAWALIGLLWGFCLLAVFSVGLFVVPVAALLALAALLTPAGRRPDSPPIAV